MEQCNHLSVFDHIILFQNPKNNAAKMEKSPSPTIDTSHTRKLESFDPGPASMAYEKIVSQSSQEDTHI